MDHIEMVARQAIIDQENIDITSIRSVSIGFPKLTSAVTATFEVLVTLDDESSFSVPITARIKYSHPVAI